MTLDELLRLLEAGESERCEWKQAGDVTRVADDVVKTLSALANDHARVGAGLVACGVAEEFVGGVKRPLLSGLDARVAEDLQQAVLGKCQSEVSPVIAPVVQGVILPDAGRVVLLWQQDRSAQVHLWRGRYYVRLRDKTALAKPEQIHDLHRQRAAPVFLEGPCLDTTRDDLLPAAVEEFLGRRRRPLPADAYLEPGVPLTSRAVPLFVERRLPSGEQRAVPQRFTVLLFGREPQRFFPGATVIFSVYDATTRATERAERYEITGPLVFQAQSLLERLKGYVGVQIDKSGDPTNGRAHRERYALGALREAAMNALVHRDYEDRDPTRVTVFSDRIEFVSPGGLLPGVRPALVAAGRAGPLWRNSSLAAVLGDLGLVEDEGSGIARMIEETVAVAGQPPRFLFDQHQVAVVIPAYVPRPRVEVGAAAEQALVLVSIGGPSIRAQVEAALPDLDLAGAAPAVDYAHEGFVETEADWAACARELRDALRAWGDAPQVRQFHVFYRGPVALAALVGALMPQPKGFSMYYYGPSGYERAFTLDQKFRKERS